MPIHETWLKKDRDKILEEVRRDSTILALENLQDELRGQIERDARRRREERREELERLKKRRESWSYKIRKMDPILKICFVLIIMPISLLLVPEDNRTEKEKTLHTYCDSICKAGGANNEDVDVDTWTCVCENKEGQVSYVKAPSETSFKAEFPLNDTRDAGTSK